MTLVLPPMMFVCIILCSTVLGKKISSYFPMLLSAIIVKDYLSVVSMGVRF
jgi:hypothetical protein